MSEEEHDESPEPDTDHSPDEPDEGGESTGDRTSTRHSLTHTSTRDFSLTEFGDQPPDVVTSNEAAVQSRRSRAAIFGEYPIVVPIQVRWGDMDAFAHVNNIIYFQYFEQARIRFFRESLPDFDGSPDGIGPILASTSARFKAPVTYPDTLHVGVRVADVEDDRFTMEFSAFSEELQRVAATGDALVVSYDYAARRPVSIPAAWREALGPRRSRRE